MISPGQTFEIELKKEDGGVISDFGLVPTLEGSSFYTFCLTVLCFILSERRTKNINIRPSIFIHISANFCRLWFS